VQSQLKERVQALEADVASAQAGRESLQVRLSLDKLIRHEF
jgi:hypothetical protein